MQTGRTGNWNEIGSVVIGDKIQFSGPALTTKDMARVGHAVKMVLRVVDPVSGEIGSSESAPVILKYKDPKLTTQIITRQNNSNAQFSFAVVGENLGAYSNVGEATFCKKIDFFVFPIFLMFLGPSPCFCFPPGFFPASGPETHRESRPDPTFSLSRPPAEGVEA